MDWMNASADGGLLPSPPPLEVAKLQAGQIPPMPVGSFDAIRVYLWAGIANPKTPHVQEELEHLSGMAVYLNSHPAPPVVVGPEGQVINPAAPAGFSAAVIPYLDARGQVKTSEAQNDRLQALLDSKSGLYGKDGLYYDQNLVLFEEGWRNGRFKFDREGALLLKWK